MLGCNIFNRKVKYVYKCENIYLGMRQSIKSAA